MKLAAKELRVSQPTRSDLVKIKRRDVFIICDNVLDTYNIGSIFRLADAVAAKCVYLCGQSETPPNSRISKASVGTDKWIKWQYASTVVEAVSSIKYQVSGIKIIAIEQSKKSIDFRKTKFKEPIAFVIGNETEGVSKEALKLADQVVEIPMFGIN